MVRSGKTLKICAADVFAIKDGKENLCATSLSTIMAMAGKSDAPAGPNFAVRKIRRENF